MSDKEIIQAVLELLKKGMCFLRSAENEAGSSVRAEDDSAVKFCSYGALERVCSLNNVTREQFIRIVLSVRGNEASLISWHDKSSKEQVLERWQTVLEASK